MCTARFIHSDSSERLPGKSFDDVMAMSLEARKAAGIHHAYSIAGIPFPWRTEQTHTMMIGSTGTGKTTQMRALIAQMRARRDRAVIFDLTGAYVEAFYNAQTDVILNPMDERCPSWTLFDEAKNHADFTNIAAALMPHDGGTAEPFWILSARTLFVESCTKLVKAGTPTNQALASRLMMAELEAVHELVQRTVAEPLTAPEAARMAESVRAVLNTNAQALLFLPEHNPPFSICDWVRKEDSPGSILFITSSHSELTLRRSAISWVRAALLWSLITAASWRASTSIAPRWWRSSRIDLPRRFEKSTNHTVSGTAMNSEMNNEPHTARIIRFHGNAHEREVSAPTQEVQSWPGKEVSKQNVRQSQRSGACSKRAKQSCG